MIRKGEEKVMDDKIKVIDGGVTAARGFQAAGIAAGIKKGDSMESPKHLAAENRDRKPADESSRPEWYLFRNHLLIRSRM